jgi:hypothetical protein
MVTMGTQFATFSVHLSCFSGSLASCASVHNSFLQVQVFDIRTAEISGQDFHERTMEIHGQDFISEQISANKCVEFLNEKHITSLISKITAAGHIYPWIPGHYSQLLFFKTNKQGICKILNIVIGRLGWTTANNTDKQTTWFTNMYFCHMFRQWELSFILPSLAQVPS